MVKKPKVRKETNIELNTSTKWVIVLAVITLLIVLNILGTRNLIIKTWNKLRPTPTPTPSQKINISPAEGLNTDQASYAKLAEENLAVRLKIKKEDITLQSVKQKEWGDSSLGCPQKGKLYIQSITSGYEIALSAKGKKYIYHGGLNRVVSC